MVLRNPLARLSAVSLVAVSASSAQAVEYEIIGSRYAVDVHQSVLTTLLPNPDNPNLPPVEHGRTINDVERVFLRERGAYSSNAVVDGIIDPIVMTTDDPVSVIPDSFIAPPLDTIIQHKPDQWAFVTDDGLLVRSQM